MPNPRCSQFPSLGYPVSCFSSWTNEKTRGDFRAHLACFLRCSRPNLRLFGRFLSSIIGTCRLPLPPQVSGTRSSSRSTSVSGPNRKECVRIGSARVPAPERLPGQFHGRESDPRSLRLVLRMRHGKCETRLKGLLFLSSLHRLLYFVMPELSLTYTTSYVVVLREQ